MFNESLLMNRRFDKPLDHIKLDTTKSSRPNDLLDMVFENMKNPDWQKVVGLNFCEAMLLTHRELTYLSGKLRELNDFKKKQKSTKHDDLERTLKELED